MINIRILTVPKYLDTTHYKPVGEGVFEDLTDQDGARYRIAFSFELEDGEDTQYPVEDLLDKYFYT